MSREPCSSTSEANCNDSTSIPSTISPTIIPSSTLQIPPKCFMKFLQTQISASQPTFAILSNKEFRANIRPNYSLAAIKQSQSNDIIRVKNNAFAVSLAPFTSTLADKSRIKQHADVLNKQQPYSKPLEIQPFISKTYPHSSGNLQQSYANNLSSAVAGSNFCKNWILKSIDKLKENQLRPDAEKICKLMKLYWNISREDTVKCLDELTDSGLVARVECMRDITYQNLFKLKREIDKENINPGSIANLIRQSSRNLEEDRILQSENQNKSGFSIKENEQGPLASQICDTVELTKTQLKRCLDCETELERVDRVYSIGESHKDCEIPRKKAAFCHKSNPDEPTANAPSPFHYVSTGQTPSLPIATFPASHLSLLDHHQFKPNISHESSIANNCQTTSSLPSSIINSIYPPIPIDVTTRFDDINYKSTSISALPQTSVRSTLNVSLKSVIKTSQSEKPSCSTNVSCNTCEAEILTPKIINSIRQQIPAEPSIIITKENVDNNCTTGNDVKEETQLQLGISTIIQSLSSTVLSTPQMVVTSSASVDQKSTTKPRKRGRPFGSRNKRNKISEIDCSRAKKGKLEETQSNKVASSSSPLQQTVYNPRDLCIICGRPEIIGEIYMCCAICHARAHSSCLRYSPELTYIFRKLEWKCDECETQINMNKLSLKEKLYACEECGRLDKALFKALCRRYPLCLEPTWLCLFCYIKYFQSRFGQPVRQLPVNSEFQESYKENCSENIETQNRLNTEKLTVKQESFLSLVNEDLELPCREEQQEDEMMKLLTTTDNYDCPGGEGLTLQSAIFREEDVNLDPSLLFMEQRDVLAQLNFNVGAPEKKSFQ